ncbi:TIGR03619 family F420-dependent LLM class oxidoreductase [Kribbella sandramycini]|uniref:Putative F420-dependent oxidoreductase n=1 Tax=Kribbella sandramycini TaxID=60450 RepID=A0A7Y4L5G8_9ACTN|nr:TIGR03619 family F420-dependent LLM class oxidoreductase [Kribbella sandramycini]MBB6571045.1 putative F420-dependent oxidoreductase [Kribbella sandramycini]NOL43546.1 TIGR03619 family F420-dependent LLM class oxidoreductase [Kribbella sandramycini]
MKLGVMLPQTWKFAAGDVVRGAREAEEVGYDSVWASERLLYPVDQTGVHRLTEYGDGAWPDVYRKVLDPLVAMSLAAAVTTRVRVGSSVIVPPLHVPFRLASSLASIGAASGGRVVAGLGTGWSVDEFAAAAPRPMKERGAALDEFLDIAEAIWRPDPVEFENDRYKLWLAEIGPKPAEPIPVYLGGWGPKALARVAKRADGWLPVMVPPRQLGETLADLRKQAEQFGRDPQSLRATAIVALGGEFTRVDSGERAAYQGSVEQIMGDLAELAEVGVDEAVLTLHTVARDIEEYSDLLKRFHQEFLVL